MPIPKDKHTRSKHIADLSIGSGTITTVPLHDAEITLLIGMVLRCTVLDSHTAEITKYKLQVEGRTEIVKRLLQSITVPDLYNSVCTFVKEVLPNAIPTDRR